MSLREAFAGLADRTGRDLPPDWWPDDGTAAGDFPTEGEERLAMLCERLEWPAPRMLSLPPQPGDFPLLAFRDGEGWALAERLRDDDLVVVPSTADGLWPVGEGTRFYELGVDADRLDAETGTGEPARAMPVFRRALLRRKGMFASAILATVVVNIIALATSLYSMQVYDRVIPRSGFSTLWVLTIGVVVALLFDFLLRTTRALMIEREAAGIDGEVSNFFFGRAQAIRLDARPPGIGTMAAQVRGWEQVRSLLSSGFIFLLADLPFALFFILVIAWLGGAVAVVPLVALPVALVLSLIFARLVRKDTARAQVSGNRRNGLLVEAFDAAETVKANRGAWHLAARWGRLTRELESAELPVRRWSSIATSVFSALQQLSYILIVAWGAVRVTEGEMTMGALIACTILAGRVNGPLIAQLPGFLVQWGYARSSLQALDTIMRLPADLAPGTKGLRPRKMTGDLRLADVAFAYPDSASGVSIDSLEIVAGQRVAVIGGVGSGKSTLLKLLAGLYAPRQGSIRIGGLEMSQIAPDVLRAQIGYLAQDSRMLDGTLRDNLLLGLPDPGDDALMEVIEELGLAPMVAIHPRGLDLPITEGGRGLSGGQRTLANLARLLLADAPVWLLDEPTANLDRASEARVIEALRRRLAPERTLVLVTHRTRLLPLAERVLMIDGGRVARDARTQEIVAAADRIAQDAATARELETGKPA